MGSVDLVGEALEALIEQKVEEALLRHLSSPEVKSLHVQNGNGKLEPYLNVEEAADYLRCPKQRVYDLLSSGRLTRHKDGSRVLLSREEISAHIKASL